MKAPTKTVLVLRLSSMGDLLLSTAFLENLPPGVAVDWIINDKFAFILEGHPRIRKLYLYNKKTGLSGWIQLIRAIARQQYDARVDLHVTIRSLIARLIFLAAGKPMLRVGKERIRTSLYFILKGLTPGFLRPSPYWKRFSKMGLKITRRLGIPAPVSTSGALHPPRFPIDIEDVGAESIFAEYQLKSKNYIAVMPASRWASKEWGSDKYFEALQTLAATHPHVSKMPILVLGRDTDSASVQLLERLGRAGFQGRSALAEDEFRITAFLLQHALLYLGGDTGLAHLAEAVGTPAVMIFGPTQPDVGFGPWRDESRAVSSNVVCSPCSKDGRPCYRVGQPYQCFKAIHPERVATTLIEALR